jgi:hypothetical protein
MNRPDWLNHEGYYRILVIVRFLLFVPTLLWGGIVALTGVYYTVGGSPDFGAERLYVGSIFIIISFVVVILLNLLLRVVGWVVAGFKEGA